MIVDGFAALRETVVGDFGRAVREVKAHVRGTTRRLQTQLAECQQLARSDAVTRQQARTTAEQRPASLGRLEATAKALRVEVESHSQVAAPASAVSAG